jgi:uncharacterized protein
MEITIEKLNEQEIEKRNIRKWPIWEKEISEFDWFYDSQEQCLFLEGKVTIKTDSGNEYHIVEGDFVTFPQGLSCVWKVIEPVRKHYQFS